MRTKKKHWQDPQRRGAWAECALCGGEIYWGEPGFRVGSQTVCPWCVHHWLGEVRP